jgi:hypothetical protein
MLTIGTSFVLMRRGTTAAAALAGAAAGLATAAKYPGLAFGSVVAWAIIERWWRDRSVGGALRLAVAAGLPLVASFVLACPSCALHADALVTLLYRHRQMAAFAGFAGACLAPPIGWWHRPWVYEVVASLPYGLGLPFAVLALAGVGAALRRRAPADRLLLAAVLPYFAYMGASAVVYARYMLPLFPPFAILGAAALARIERRRLATLVVALVVAYGTALSASQLTRFSWDQQAAIAAWLGDRLPLVAPADRRVNLPTPLGTDPYFNLRRPIVAAGYQVTTQPDLAWLRGRPGFFVMPEWLSMTIKRDRRNFLLSEQMSHIESGAAAYRPVLRIPSPPYLQRGWDERWDPTFRMELWQGSMGFTVYARNDVLPDVGSVEVLPPLPPRPMPVASPPHPG